MMEDQFVEVVVAGGSRSFVVVEVVEVGSLLVAAAGNRSVEVAGIVGWGQSLLDQCGGR
jgi:hypothetical protein